MANYGGISVAYVSVTSSSLIKHAQPNYRFTYAVHFLSFFLSTQWLNFGLAFINDGDSVVRWRFPLAFQCLPAILLILSVRFLPDSPRYLCQAGRSEEAWEVLKHVRGDQSTPAEVQAEFDEMTEAAKKSGKYNPLEAVSILCGLAKGGRHLAKRAWLCIWLQLMAEWTGT